MADRRKAELEEKRAKVAELRRARDERKALLAQSADKPSEPLTTNRKDVNDLVESLLGGAGGARPGSPFVGLSRQNQTPSTSHSPLPPSSQGQYASSSAGPGGRSTPTTSIPGTPGGRTSRMSNEGGSEKMGFPGISGPGRSTPVGPMADREIMGSPFQQSVDFVDHSSELYELPTKAIAKPVTYSKAIQTSVSTSTDDLENDDMGEDEADRRNRSDGGSGRETEEEMRKRIMQELEAERKALEEELQALKKAGEAKGLPDLSNEQRQAIFAQPDFTSFIEESTRIVQRALSDGYDYIRDYSIGVDGGFDEADGQRVKLVCAFSDERWTAGRSVTDLDWSPKYPELVVASYNKNPKAPNDPDGIVAVWNLHLLERSEFVFHSPSDVLSVTFSPFHPNLIFGGSYSGQVLLWDTRAKQLPVLKTPLSASGHTYPIYAMKMVGTQNANNLITSSTDGMVCSWLADMLAQPQEALPLIAPSHNKTDEVSITCLDFPDSETATFWIGTEEGSVYQANRYDRASSKAGLSSAPDDIYRGHSGPITGIHFHPSSGSIDFSDLFLTSSVDWTVKLWRTKATSSTSAPTKSAPERSDKNAPGISPLTSFEEANDYVFDAKWHPNHPAMFGTVDGSGKFDLWNLNHDTEVPIVSTQVSSRAINKLAWDKTQLSRKAALGSSDGKVYVYDVAEKMVSPRDNEWTEFQKSLQGMKAAQQPTSLSVDPPSGSRFAR